MGFDQPGSEGFQSRGLSEGFQSIGVYEGFMRAYGGCVGFTRRASWGKVIMEAWVV